MSISYEDAAAQQETLEFSSNPYINRKIKDALSGLQQTIKRMVSRFPTDQDKEQTADFLLACQRQENIAVKSKRVYVTALNYLSKHHGYSKPFKSMSDKDVADYLGSLYKDRNTDPDQGWISNHNTMAAPLSKFYRWLYYPDLSPQERRHLSKEQLAQIPQLKLLHFIPTSGKPRSPIKSRDKWDEQDFATALRWIQGNPRLTCFIAFMKDLSARPDEVLQLRLRDIDHAIKLASDGSEYARIQVGRHSKKKTPRGLPLVHAVKYYRVWRHQHPVANNPDAYIFISREQSAKYQNIPMSVDALRFELKKLRKRYFPALLKRADIPQNERAKIEKLLSRKFTPYALRHSSLQLYARSGISEYAMRLHAGWNKTSDMIEVYTTEEGGESCEDILRMAYNIETRDNKQQQEIQEELKGKPCPYCGVQNLQHAQTCIECGKVIDPIKLGIMIEEADRTKKELEEYRIEKEKAQKVTMEHRQAIAEIKKEMLNLKNEIDLVQNRAQSTKDALKIMKVSDEKMKEKVDSVIKDLLQQRQQEQEEQEHKKKEQP
jgi:integrase